MTSEIPDFRLPDPVERILVLENPVSKNGAKGNRQLEDLVDLSGLPFEFIKTDRDPAVTIGRLSILEPTDLLYVIGGDGTNNQALAPILAMDQPPLMLPTRSGNANDFAMSVNGRLAPWQIYRDYLNGDAKAVNVHPIEISIYDSEVSQTQFAINYVSFGYAALASDYLNRSWEHPRLEKIFHRLPIHAQSVARFPRDGFLLGKAAYDAKSFAYAEGDKEKFIKAADISIVHSARMAKLGRFNVRHTDPFVFNSLLTKASVLAMGNQFIKMMSGRMVGNNVVALDFCLKKTTDDELYYQVDGEATALPERSEITVRLADSSLKVLSTRLN